MKPERMRIRLAEWAGWKKCVCGDVHCGAWFPPDSDDPALDCPDYDYDLNAVRELEEKLLKFSQEQPTDALWKEYRICLEGICGACLVFHASAFQRCEALCKTLGLWEDA